MTLCKKRVLEEDGGVTRAGPAGVGQNSEGRRAEQGRELLGPVQNCVGIWKIGGGTRPRRRRIPKICQPGGFQTPLGGSPRPPKTDPKQR